MAMAAAMNKGKGVVMLISMLVLALAFMGVGKCTAGAAGDQLAGGVQQTTYKDSAASALAFGQQSLFECPCSNQFCDGNVFEFCSCNDDTCSCDCHNAVQTKVPGGATIQLRPTP